MPIHFSIPSTTPGETGTTRLPNLELSVEEAYRIHFMLESLHARWGPLLDPVGRTELTPEKIDTIIRTLADQRYYNAEVFGVFQQLMRYPVVYAEGS